MQKKLPSPLLSSNFIKTTSNTIIENITPDYSRIIGDKIITRPNHITRVLNQNTRNVETLIDLPKFEVMCRAIYDNEANIGYLVETNTRRQHTIILPKIKQVDNRNYYPL